MMEKWVPKILEIDNSRTRLPSAGVADTREYLNQSGALPIVDESITRVLLR